MAYYDIACLDYEGMHINGYLADLVTVYNHLRDIEGRALGSIKTTAWRTHGVPTTTGNPHFNVTHSVLGNTNIALATEWLRAQIGIPAYTWDTVTPSDPRNTPVGPRTILDFFCAIGRAGQDLYNGVIDDAVGINPSINWSSSNDYIPNIVVGLLSAKTAGGGWFDNPSRPFYSQSRIHAISLVGEDIEEQYGESPFFLLEPTGYSHSVVAEIMRFTGASQTFNEDPLPRPVWHSGSSLPTDITGALGGTLDLAGPFAWLFTTSNPHDFTLAAYDAFTFAGNKEDWDWGGQCSQNFNTTISRLYHYFNQSPINYLKIAPGKAYKPFPVSGVTGQSIEPTLTWDQMGNAVSYDVYFGTDSTPDAGEFIGNQAGKSYAPGTLSANTLYYWRIDTVNTTGTTTGTVWSFRTAP